MGRLLINSWPPIIAPAVTGAHSSAQANENQSWGTVTEPSKAVFLSYASEDTEAARRICEALRSAGIEVWFDQSELRGGDAWDHKIREQVRDCALFIPIISARTQARPEGYFRLEWDVADQRSHMIGRSKAFIVPVCIDSTPERGADVPDAFFKVQWTRLPGGATSAAFCERVRVLLGDAAAIEQPQTTTMPMRLAVPKRSWQRWMPMVAVSVLAAVGVAGLAWRPLAHRLTLSPSPATAALPEKSIAVLPFVDMSEKHDQEYFSDGLSEELINLLAKSPDLRVPARTSSFYFKGKQVTVGEIAKTLNVAHVLEGSVRKSGNELRITAQLIRVADGYHLWSDSYDRELKDIFRVQDEIASEVVQALKVKLEGAPKRAKEPTENVAAHNLLLEGRFFADRFGPGDTETAISSYQRALKEDPGYALAWAELAWALLWQSPLNIERVKDATLKAVELGPNLADAHAMRGWYQSQIGYDWAEAESEFDTALRLEPENTRALWGKGQLARALRRFDESIHYYNAAHDRDPVNASLLQAISETLMGAGRTAEGVRIARRSLEISPNIQQGHFYLGIALYFNGELEAALKEIRLEPDKVFRLSSLAVVEHARNQLQASDAALRELIASDAPDKEFRIAAAYASRADAKAAVAWLERARENQPIVVVEVGAWPMFNPIRSDPGFQTFLRKLKLPET